MSAVRTFETLVYELCARFATGSAEPKRISDGDWARSRELSLSD
jgi:hypothetical protein